MRWSVIAILAAALLAGFSAPAAAEKAVGQPRVADVLVERDGESWTAEYRFARSAPAWAFVHSALVRRDKQPWRPRSFTVTTPGVRLVRRGRYDLLAADQGAVPRRVRIRFAPSTLDLEAAYDPALRFSDGSVALYTGQFKVAPLDSAAAAEPLPMDIEKAGLVPGSTRTTFRDRSGKVLHAGERKRVAVVEGEASYVLFGAANVIDSPAVATILDPALPRWLASELGTGTTRLLSYYSKRLGPRVRPKPMLMATWAGPTPGRTSMGGSVLPGLVVMALEGAGLAATSERALEYIRWFIGHEAAHFWLGEAVTYDRSRHAWMFEGGAELLAIRAMAELEPGYDPRTRLNDSVSRCIGHARGQPINNAEERSGHDAYYACGAVFGLVAEAAANRAEPGSGFTGFWRRLIDANRPDRVVSQEEWLHELTARSGDPTLARDIRIMAEQGVAAPETVIASLFARAGVWHSLAPDGTPRLL